MFTFDYMKKMIMGKTRKLLLAIDDIIHVIILQSAIRNGESDGKES